MAFDPDFEELQRDEPGRQETGGAQDRPRRRGAGRALPVFLCLLLTAAGFFLMFYDGKRDVRHGVCRCGDGRMMELPCEPDMDKIDQTADGIGQLAQAHPEIAQYMMLIPSAACVQPDYLPAGLQIRDQKADLSMVRSKMPQALSWIDLYELFSVHAGEKLYYATDIYLTGWGSRYASGLALEKMGARAPEGKDTCYLLSDSYEGKLAADRDLVQRLTGNKKERLEIYIPEEEAAYYRVDGLTGRLSGSLYDSRALRGTQQYDVFFGGNRPLTEICTTAVNGQALLVIGDREADSVVPGFVSSFEKIILVHPDKSPATIEKLIGEYQPTGILYLYGANSFMRDRALLHALGK